MATQTEKSKPKERAGDIGTPARAAETAPVPYRGGGTLAPAGEWEPFRQMRQEFDRLFDRFFGGLPAPWEAAGGVPGGAGSHWQWGLDVREDDNTVTVRAEAPGFDPADFDLQVRG